MSTTKWKLDPAHSEIQFKVKHLMVTNVTGRFTDFDANIETSSENFEGADISFSAKTESIDTSNKDRDTHLRSNDFSMLSNIPNSNLSQLPLNLKVVQIMNWKEI